MARRLVFLLLLSGVSAARAPAALEAQSFSGVGPQATQLFNLPVGLKVFEFEHRADRGAFTVRLLDEHGTPVHDLARAEGRFGGSRAVGIDEAGRYLLDVAATGAWTIRIREAVASGIADEDSPEFAEGREAGMAASSGAGGWRWFTGGLAGGALAGPIGAAIAVGVAGRSDVRDVPPGPLEASVPFRQGYQVGFERSVVDARRRQAFVGGMVGSAVFVGVIIALLKIAGDGGEAGEPPPDDGVLFHRTIRWQH